MRVGIISLLLALVLGLGLCLPAVAGSNNTTGVTITMDTESLVGISLSKASWGQGDGLPAIVSSNTEYFTSPPIEWCTLTVSGNCNVNTFIVGEDAKWVGGEYNWTLSTNGTNGDNIYGLWFRISGDTTRGPNGDGYVPIAKTQVDFWPYPGGSGSSLAPGDTKKFGLKLLTPTYFIGGRQMQTRITIRAVKT